MILRKLMNTLSSVIPQMMPRYRSARRMKYNVVNRNHNNCPASCWVFKPSGCWTGYTCTLYVSGDMMVCV